MPVQEVSLDGQGEAHRYPHDHDHDKEEDKEAFHAGRDAHAHNALDSKDERSIKNKLAAYEHDEHTPHETQEPQHEFDKDTRVSLKTQENRGARIDGELEREDEEIIRKMDEKGKHTGHHDGMHHKHGH